MITCVVGGGTFSYVRNHMALAAPAFGGTAKKLAGYLEECGESVSLILTRMADPQSRIETNDDLSKFAKTIIADKEIKALFWNPAVCDFNGTVGDIESGRYAQRLKTSKGETSLVLTPADKIVQSFKTERPDLFLVSFKTTTNASTQEMYSAGKKQAMDSKANLVLVNDTVRRKNLVVTGDDAEQYKVQDDREQALKLLVLVSRSKRWL